MKRLLLVALLSASMVVLPGCGVSIVNGSGKLVTETRPVSNFSSFVLAGLGDVTITQGATESLVIEAEDNVMPLLKSEVKNGTLTLLLDQKDWKDVVRPTKGVKIALGVKTLTVLELTGVGNIEIPALKTTNFAIKVSGAGNIKVAKLEATNLTSTLSGVGNTDLTGQVISETVEISGAGQFSAANLSCQAAKLTLTGTGNATVWVRDTLDVTIGGAGNVTYYGTPKVTKTITGIGVMSPMGAK
jgi:hypothetical protein